MSLSNMIFTSETTDNLCGPANLFHIAAHDYRNVRPFRIHANDRRNVVVVSDNLTAASALERPGVLLNVDNSTDGISHTHRSILLLLEQPECAGVRCGKLALHGQRSGIGLMELRVVERVRVSSFWKDTET